ncbi:MAG: hypothetical protein LBV58_04875 [Acholeplasmatales bacterium]|jgi:biotin carboxylase|nr:hypothetical protein [Acholeplasmatales bacterium]
MIFVFISPNFPDNYYNFVVSLKERGVKVIGIGDTSFLNLREELKASLEEYVQTDLNNYLYVKNTIDYIYKKYGFIDFIESNNEYWLELDAKLRTQFNVSSGLKIDELEKIKRKSRMKECFLNANIKVPRYILPRDLDAAIQFVNEVGFPVFVKPDIGVGAQDSHSIKNHRELELFFIGNPYPNRFIMEEFVDGDLISFDGIADNESNALFCIKECFKYPGERVINEDLDDSYYSDPFLDTDFVEIGKRIIKSFNVKKRYFHIELFVLKKDKEGLGKKKDIIGLEVNMRSPGGNTVLLINKASGVSTYDLYADIITTNTCSIDSNRKKCYAISSSRKDHYNYINSVEDIFSKYEENIFSYGTYPKEISKMMGDTYFYASFETLKDLNEFDEFVRKKVK